MRFLQAIALSLVAGVCHSSPNKVRAFNPAELQKLLEQRLEVQARAGKSLINTFPFNQQEQPEHHGEGHGEGHGAGHGAGHHGAGHGEESSAVRSSIRLPERQSQQARYSPTAEDEGSAPPFDEVASSDPGRDGKRCIEKVEMVEETVYDDVVQCDHSYDKRCHTTYITNYETQQEEECDENYRKSCFIEYQQVATDEDVEICRRPLVKDCNVQGPEICRTEYESECWTKQEEHEVEDDVVTCITVIDEKCEDETSGYTTSTKCHKWPREECSVEKKTVKKYTPITGCTKEPREICAPAGCGFTEGAEECYTTTKTIISDQPKETCSLEPQRTCKHVSKLVPKLEPSEECVDVPKEVCTRAKTNPRKIKKPVIKKWCYVPSEESGLA